MSEKIALVDMDGTLCNFDKAMRRDLVKLAGPNEPPPRMGKYDGMPDHIKARRELIKSQPGWWRELEPMEDGMHVLNLMETMGFDVHILTQGPRGTTSAWSEKVQWCVDHLGLVGDRYDITITRNKGIAYGRVLMDDWPEYGLAWLEHRPRGLLLMPDRPWNKGFKHPNCVRMTNLTRVFKALQAAFDREDGADLDLTWS